MTSTDTLLPCPVPWCVSDVLEVVRSPWSRGYGVSCQNCRAQGPDCATESEAIAAWNRRAILAEARKPDNSETAWLLERDYFGELLYFSAECQAEPPTDWTRDNLQALRFARRIDAERFASRECTDGITLRVAEHMWCGMTEARKPEPASTPPTPATDANPFVGTNWQVRSDTPPPTPAAEEREAVARAISTKTFAYCIGGSGDCGDWEEMDTRATDIYLNAADAALSALAPVRAQEIAAARAEEQGYRHTQVAALKQVHAAEILAAEANERARALGQAAEHINRLEAALRGLLSTVERLDISEGVCCCGDDMATHAEPMSCGHTPVDAGHYHHGNAIQQARDAIEHGAGK